MLQKIFQKTFSQLKLFLSRKRTKKIVQQKNNIHKHETLKIYCLSNGNKNENQSVLNFKGGKNNCGKYLWPTLIFLFSASKFSISIEKFSIKQIEF